MHILKWDTMPYSNAMTINDEDDVMQRAKHNPAEFAPLYDGYFDRVYGYCFKRTGNAQDAEDLTSQIFVRVLNSLHTYKSNGFFAAWLFRIAHNVLSDHYRQLKVAVSIDELEFAGSDHPPDRLEKHEDHVILNELVAKLKKEKQDILLLSIQAGLTSDEIGQIVGKKATAVRVQLHRIISDLRQQYLQRIGE